jgi:hypothetical protein
MSSNWNVHYFDWWRIHSSREQMELIYIFLVIRHILAVIHFNSNLQREKKPNSDNSERIKVSYPKFKNGEATIRSVRVAQNFGRFLSICKCKCCLIFGYLYFMIQLCKFFLQIMYKKSTRLSCQCLRETLVMRKLNWRKCAPLLWTQCWINKGGGSEKKKWQESNVYWRCSTQYSWYVILSKICCLLFA